MAAGSEKHPDPSFRPRLSVHPYSFFRRGNSASGTTYLCQLQAGEEASATHLDQYQALPLDGSSLGTSPSSLDDVSLSNAQEAASV